MESEGINESDNYTGGCLGGLNEPGWAVLARTPGTPLLFACVLGCFDDLSEPGPRFYVSSEERRLPQHSVPVSALGHQE